MNRYLAWFITFNFINFSWVFFRAKEWDDAVKVLKGMVGFNGVILPSFLQSKLQFLTTYNIEFGKFLQHIQGDKFTLIYIIMTLFVIIYNKNSIEKAKEFKPNNYNLVFICMGLLITFYFFEINKVSEFLYFNF